MVVAKFLLALVGAVAMSVVAATTDGTFTTVEKIQVAVAAAMAAAVWIAANTPALVWAKTAVAVVLAVLNGSIGVITDGMQPADWWTLLVAALTVLGVYAVPNGTTAQRPLV